MDLIIVTGISGAGKSLAINALEDMGYYCVDNVPPSLLGKFAELSGASQGQISKMALGVDARSRDMFSDYLACLDELRESGQAFQVLFLSCDDKVLQIRYKETRRRHPLQGTDGISVGDAITLEKDILEPAMRSADFVVDTSMLSASQLRNRIREMFSAPQSGAMMISCVSFGFKFGAPLDADLMFDVRCLPNPFYVEELKNQVGTQQPVRDYVMSFEQARGLSERILSLMDYLIPLYIQEGKSQLVITFGCTGGKHRSVVFAELLAEHFKEHGISVFTVHRDIARI